VPSSIAHAAVAVIANPLLERDDRSPALLWPAAGFAAAPDLDAVRWILNGGGWLPDAHRGVTHSLVTALATSAVLQSSPATLRRPDIGATLSLAAGTRLHQSQHRRLSQPATRDAQQQLASTSTRRPWCAERQSLRQVSKSSEPRRAVQHMSLALRGNGWDSRAAGHIHDHARSGTRCR
jgi:hypothetical protein